MPSSAALGRLEQLLAAKRLDRTVGFRPVQSVMPTGVAELDGPLGGGWPKGELSELTGPRSSGRTGALVAPLTAATRAGGITGLVDVLERFDPVTAARAGLDLDRVLWVRGQPLTAEARSPKLEAKSLRMLVQNGVRAFDLIIRAGGFAVVALDLGDVPPAVVTSLPFTTWLRLAHANEGRDTVALLIGDAPAGRSARGRTMRLNAIRRWTGTSRQSRRFAGFDLRVSA